MSSVAAILTGMQLLVMCFMGAAPRVPWLVSGVADDGGRGGILSIPSAASLGHCPTRCGEAGISYPFGTAPGCFRQGFELTCDHSTRLFLTNNTTEILAADVNSAYASIAFNITLTPGKTTYTGSWESPAEGLNIDFGSYMYVVGCDIEVVLFDSGTNLTIGSCISMCLDNKALMGKVDVAVHGQCNGLGCCSIGLSAYMRGFRFTLSRRRDGVKTRSRSSDAEPSIVKVFLTEQDYFFDTRDLYSSWIIGNFPVKLIVFITDQPSCEVASANKGTYACSPGSSCGMRKSGAGYSCYCNDNPTSVGGNNPYILDGCIEGYNPNPRRNCTRWCGNMSIPFPFGLEEGCFAHEKFRLACVDNKFTVLDHVLDRRAKYHITNLSVEGGYLDIAGMLNDSSSSDDGLAMAHTINGFSEFSQEFDIRMRWAVTNLTCRSASQRPATYACISAYSECINVTHGMQYVGYRCKCLNGFYGNPYVPDGCKGLSLSLSDLFLSQIVF